MQKVLDSALLSDLLTILNTCTILEIRREACWAICNMAALGTPQVVM